MGNLVIRVGVIGLSEGNGHPFSFSAIINGYDEEGFADSGWPVIHDYLKDRTPDEFGFDDVRVTHAWTQDPVMTRKLCRASSIEHSVVDYREMLGQVDAVLIARDDWSSHFEMARPFLDAGLAVFVDKPLSLDDEQLRYFRPFLDAGKLMSCSCLRFARELEQRADVGIVKNVNATVVINWERYGIHMLEAVFEMLPARPVSIGRQPAHHDALSIAMDDGSVFNVNAIGAAPKTFRLEVFGDTGCFAVNLSDNFSAFRATLARFFAMCRDGVPPIFPEETMLVMKTIKAGLSAEPGGRHVKI